MNTESAFRVEGMSCGHCEMAVVRAVTSIPGVKDARASHEKKSIVITHEGTLDPAEVKLKVQEAGYMVVD
jgi:copper chaperone CopZ